MDPALVRYANMYVKRHEYFRWTPRTAWLTLVYVVIVPSGFLYMANATEVSAANPAFLDMSISKGGIEADVARCGRESGSSGARDEGIRSTSSKG